MSVRSIPIFLQNLVPFEGNWISKTSLLDAHNVQTRYDAIWNFPHIFSSSTLRIFYVKLPNFEGGGEGGVCISLLGQGQRRFLQYDFISKGSDSHEVYVDEMW